VEAPSELKEEGYSPTTWDTFEQEHDLRKDLDLSLDPEVVFPPPEPPSRSVTASGASSACDTRDGAQSQHPSRDAIGVLAYRRGRRPSFAE
jgi:hypothetical protein